MVSKRKRMQQEADELAARIEQTRERQNTAREMLAKAAAGNHRDLADYATDAVFHLLDGGYPFDRETVNAIIRLACLEAGTGTSKGLYRD